MNFSRLKWQVDNNTPVVYLVVTTRERLVFQMDLSEKIGTEFYSFPAKVTVTGFVQITFTDVILEFLERS